MPGDVSPLHLDERSISIGDVSPLHPDERSIGIFSTILPNFTTLRPYFEGCGTAYFEYTAF